MPQSISSLNRRRFLQTATAAALAPSLESLAQTPAAATAPWTPLGKLAAEKHIGFGFALDYKQTTTNPEYQALVAREATLCVCENAMKWEAVHPQPDEFTFDKADAIIAFAEAHHIKMRGHTYMWHRALPPWVERETTKANAQATIEKHISTVGAHFRGKLTAWDVVNEAIYIKDDTPGHYRDFLWYRLLGPSFIPIAFHAARAADPHALLAYNDWGLEYDNAADPLKRIAVLAMLKDLVKQNVPIGALGIQAHLRAGTGEKVGAGLTDFIKAVRDLGLIVLITEIDVSDSRLSTTDNAVRDTAVADMYHRFLDTALATGAVSSVIAWGVRDYTRATGAEAGQPESQRPLIFGPNYGLKPASFAVAEAFRNAKPFSRP